MMTPNGPLELDKKKKPHINDDATLVERGL